MADLPEYFDMPVYTGDNPELKAYLDLLARTTREHLNVLKNNINMKMDSRRQVPENNAAVEVTSVDARQGQGTTVANGFGPRVMFKALNNAGELTDIGYIECVYTDVTDGSEDADIRIGTIAGGTLAERLRINNSGASDDGGSTYLT